MCVCVTSPVPLRKQKWQAVLRFKNVRDNLKTEGNLIQGSFFPTAETSGLGRISETGLLTELTRRIISSEKKKSFQVSQRHEVTRRSALQRLQRLRGQEREEGSVIFTELNGAEILNTS